MRVQFDESLAREVTECFADGNAGDSEFVAEFSGDDVRARAQVLPEDLVLEVGGHSLFQQ